MAEEFTVYIMWTIQLDNRTIVPWIKINVTPSMTIIQLKNKILQTEKYKHINDIQDIILISNDFILENEKSIADYKSFIKDKCDIYLFNVNEFGFSWPTRAVTRNIDITKITKHMSQNKEYIKLTMQTSSGTMYGLFYFDQSFINRVSKSSSISAENLLFLPAFSSFNKTEKRLFSSFETIKTSSNQIKDLNGMLNLYIWNRMQPVSVLPRKPERPSSYYSKPFVKDPNTIYLPYIECLYFMECLLNTVLQDIANQYDTTWSIDLSLLINMYLFAENEEKWVEYKEAESKQKYENKRRQRLPPDGDSRQVQMYVSCI